MTSFLLVRGDGTQETIGSDEGMRLVEDPVLARLHGRLQPGAPSGERINLMDVLYRQGIAGPDPTSDRGNFRYFPRGAFLYELMRRWMDDMLDVHFDAQRVQTPHLLNWKREDVHGQAGMFNEKLYHVRPPGDRGDEFVLRFNGDSGQFSMFAAANVQERQLPVRLYEVAKCFRYLTRGEVSGIGRGRSFTLPDMHSFCAGSAQARQEYIELTAKLEVLAGELNSSLGLVFKVPVGNYEDMKPTIVEIARASGRAVFVRLYDQQAQYWCMKHMAFTDDGMPMFHVQLDYENGERYGVYYQSKEGERVPCSVVHTTIGSVEWWLLHFIGRAAAMQAPMLPVWMSPTQVRVIPVNWERHGQKSVDLMRMLNTLGIRADIDDRDMRFGARIAASGKDWVPYTIVMGDAELEGGILSVRLRDGSQERVQREDFFGRLRAVNTGRPSLPIPVRFLSRQLEFGGMS